MIKMNKCKGKMCWFFICIWPKVLEIYEWVKNRKEKKINYNVLSTLFHIIVQTITSLFPSLKTNILCCFDHTRTSNLANRSGIREADLQEMAKASNINWSSIQPPIFTGENYEF